jgi:hypothetical protein
LPNNSYRKGRSAESARLAEARKKYNAILGQRFRGSKVSKTWIKNLGFNPKVDLWYITKKGKIHFENYKYKGKNQPKARIDKSEVDQLQQFAEIFKGMEHIDVSYILKNAYQKSIKVKLN